jgi:hypothetical protein
MLLQAGRELVLLFNVRVAGPPINCRRRGGDARERLSLVQPRNKFSAASASVSFDQPPNPALATANRLFKVAA